MSGIIGASSSRCLHGMDQRFCSRCHPVRKPQALRTYAKRNKPQPGKGLPSVRTWLTFAATIKDSMSPRLCIHCRLPIELFKENPIIIGSRVRKWDREVIDTINEVDITNLKAKVIVMTVTGPGCPDCNYLLIRAEAAEVAAYEKANEAFMTATKDWRRDYVRQVGWTPSKRRAFLSVEEMLIERQQAEEDALIADALSLGAEVTIKPTVPTR